MAKPAAPRPRRPRPTRRTATSAASDPAPPGAAEPLEPADPAGDPAIGDPAEGPDPDPIDEPERGPLRRCLATRAQLPKEQMIRFVLAPDRTVLPDLAGRLPGRGMWLSAQADVLEGALRRGAFAKAARSAVQLPPDLRARIEDGLRDRVRDLIGFARRGGQAVAGWDAVRDWLAAGRVGLVVQASDGSPAERARLLGGWRGPVVTPLSAAGLGGMFGRDAAVHVAVASGRLATALINETTRLTGMQAGASAPGAAAVKAGGPASGPAGPSDRPQGRKDRVRSGE